MPGMSATVRQIGEFPCLDCPAMADARRDARRHDREIVRLAVPAFLALVAEPLFLLGDAAVVGHLGTEELAGLGIAATVLQTAVGLCVFLAYGTTASVARSLGAGDLRAALAQGVDGLWLATGLGVVLTVAGVALADPLVGVFGASAAVEEQAVAYLRVAVLGITPLLLMLAATGVLRGLQDTRTPLVVAVVGNVANLVLNVVLVCGAGLGIAGSALGSVLAQVGCAAALTVVVVRGARRERSPLRPDRAGIARSGRAGVALVVRTLTLRAALLVTAYAVTAGGTAGEIATHQLALTLWTFLAFVLDAVAIAAQAITGRYLGAGDVATVREVTRRMIRWGWVGGAVTGVLLAAASPVVGSSSPPTPRCATCSCPCCSWRPSASPWPASCSCWTACSSGPATAATWRGPAWSCSRSTRLPCCSSPAASTGWSWCGRCSWWRSWAGAASPWSAASAATRGW